MSIRVIKVHDILSVRDRQRIDRQIEEKKRELRGELVIPSHPNGKPEGMSERRMGRYSQFIDQTFQPDKGLIQKQIKHLEKVRSNGSPDSLSKAQRAALEKQVIRDREFLKSRMCPRGLMHVKANSPDFSKSKEACRREFTPEYQKVASRYKNSMRQLDQDDPEASNLERIRPN